MAEDMIRKYNILNYIVNAWNILFFQPLVLLIKLFKNDNNYEIMYQIYLVMLNNNKA
jgi:hypothetical protein